MSFKESCDSLAKDLSAKIIKAKDWFVREYDDDAERTIKLWEAYLKIEINGKVRSYKWWEVFDGGVMSAKIKRWYKEDDRWCFERDDAHDEIDTKILEQIDQLKEAHRLQM